MPSECAWISATRERFARHIVQIDVLKVDDLLADQGAKALDDFARPLVVAPDVGQDRLQLGDVRRAGFEKDRRRLGIVENGAQRLIELMRDRRRHFAGRRLPIDVGKLRHALAGRDFRGKPDTALMQQRR